ncbi:MAG: response regulator transcription factor [Bacteroidales bacterium]|jgi:DNA-binding response OmpR family regulator|nr:response regulator transcription factor [Bacteroidales bacterium]
MKISKGKIMLVEESNNLRFVLKDYFEMLDYEVLDYKESETALKAFNSNSIDMCLLDVLVLEKSGQFCLTEIRKLDPVVPIIAISPTGSKEERIQAFKLGCDDFITKPFSTEELALRIEAILNRSKRGSVETPSLYRERIFKFGDFVFNYSGMELSHPTGTRILTRKEAELLKLFCEHQNKLLPREVILKEIWGDEDYSVGRSMDVFLTKLRSYINIEKIPDEYLNPEGGRRNKYKAGFEPKVEICNIHGTGFILKVRDK